MDSQRGAAGLGSVGKPNLPPDETFRRLRRNGVPDINDYAVPVSGLKRLETTGPPNAKGRVAWASRSY